MSYNYNPIRTEAIKAAFAPLNGGLFGLAYGTAIRIGYEQIYPALFPKNAAGKTQAPNLPTVMNQLTELYKIFGGMGAHEFGIQQGVLNAMNVYENSALSLDTQQTNQAFQIAQMGIGKGVSGGFDMNILTDTFQAFQKWLQSNMNQQNFTPDQNLADLPPSDLGNPDPPHGDEQLKEQFLNKIKDYDQATLKRMENYNSLSLQEKRWAQELLNSKFGNVISDNQQSYTISEAAKTWSAKRDKYINKVHAAERQIAFNRSNATKARERQASTDNSFKQILEAKKVLRSMSNDYRSSDNFIREQAVLLRQLLQTLGKTHTQ